MCVVLFYKQVCSIVGATFDMHRIWYLLIWKCVGHIQTAAFRNFRLDLEIFLKILWVFLDSECYRWHVAWSRTSKIHVLERVVIVNDLIVLNFYRKCSNELRVVRKIIPFSYFVIWSYFNFKECDFSYNRLLRFWLRYHD